MTLIIQRLALQVPRALSRKTCLPLCGLLAALSLTACGSPEPQAAPSLGQELGIVIEPTSYQVGEQIVHAAVIQKVEGGWANAAPGELVFQLTPPDSEQSETIEASYKADGPLLRSAPHPGRLHLDYSAPAQFTEEGSWTLHLSFSRNGEELAHSSLTIPVGPSEELQPEGPPQSEEF